MPNFDISGGVGRNQLNSPLDVAYIQMALKFAPAGKHGTGPYGNYWPNKIDGKYTYKLKDAISRFKDNHFSEKELSNWDLLREGLSSIPSARSQSYLRLKSLLPSSHRNKSFIGLRLNNKFLMLQAPIGTINPIMESARSIALPDADAVVLLEHFRFIIQSYKIVPAIHSILVDHDGRFMVNVDLNHGVIVDSSTGKLTPITGQSRKDVLNYMAKRINTPLFGGRRRWEASGREKLLLRTVTRYPNLKLSSGAKTWIRWQLGAHKNQVHTEVVERALDLYEFHRIGGSLNEEESSFLIELFGEDWPKIREKQAIKERLAGTYKRNLARLISERDNYVDSLLRRENRLRALLKLPKADAWGNLLQDIVASGIGGLGNQAIFKQLRKRSSNSDSRQIEAISDGITKPVEVAVSGDDVWDGIIFGVGVVGIILVVVGTAGTAAIAMGAGSAALATVSATSLAVGNSLVRGSETADALKVVVDFYRRYNADEKLANEIADLAVSIQNAEQKLDEVILKIVNVILAVKNEEILSLGDFKFAREELQKGLSEIQSAKYSDKLAV